jgi:hypothetical protein
LGLLTTFSRNGRVKGSGLLLIRGHSWACETLKLYK